MFFVSFSDQLLLSADLMSKSADQLILFDQDTYSNQLICLN